MKRVKILEIRVYMKSNLPVGSVNKFRQERDCKKQHKIVYWWQPSWNIFRPCGFKKVGFIIFFFFRREDPYPYVRHLQDLGRNDVITNLEARATSQCSIIRHVNRYWIHLQVLRLIFVKSIHFYSKKVSQMYLNIESTLNHALIW